MITKKEEKKLIIADLACSVLATIGLFVFTYMFIVTKSNFRYAFMLFDLYALYVFFTSGYEAELYLKKRKVKKSLGSKIVLTSLEKTSIL